MKYLIAIVLTAFAFGINSSAVAHGAKSKHGGIIQVASDIQFELVNKGGVVTIYVDDHGTAVPTAGASGKLTVLNGSEKTEIDLAPAGENTLRAKGDAKLVKGSKAVALIKLANKKELAVRFAIN